MILTLIKGIKHFSFYFRTFWMKPPLTWHIFKVGDNPSSIFQLWLSKHFFLIKIKIILKQISLSIFSKFHEFVILKSKFSAKSTVFSNIFHKKRCIGRILWVLSSPRFHYNQDEVCFSPHKYIRITMNITYAKLKKKSRSRFLKPQPARAS